MTDHSDPSPNYPDHSTTQSSTQHVKRILIIQPNNIGDLILTTGILKPLKHRYPNASIVYVVQPKMVDVMAQITEVDEALPDGSLGYKGKQARTAFWALYRTLKPYRFDMILAPYHKPRYAWLAFLLRASIRVGHPYSLVNRLLYTHTTTMVETDPCTHISRYSSALLSAIDVPTEPSELTLPETLVTEADFGPPYGFFALDAGQPHKLLEPDTYIPILKHILETQPGLKIIISARDCYEHIYKPVLEALNSYKDRFELVGLCPFVDLCKLVKEAEWVVSPDSGPMHMAASYGVPVLCYFISHHQNNMNWGPWTDKQVLLASKPVSKQHGKKKELPAEAMIRGFDRLMAGDYTHRSEWPEIYFNEVNLDEPGYPSSIVGIKTLILEKNVTYLYSTSVWKRLKARLAAVWASNFFMLPVVHSHSYTISK